VDAEARQLILDHLERHDLAVLATSGRSGLPEAALMGVASTDAPELIFKTLTTTRKYANLKFNPRVELVIGCDGETTVLYEGEVTELEGKALAAAKEIYLRRWFDGRTREFWPNITYFKLRPRRIRRSDFSRPPPRIVELAAFG
jgi:general stress protein 26